MRAKTDFVYDQYRFYSDGRRVKNGVLKRYYKIKVPGIQKKVVFSEFQRHVYTLYTGNAYKTKQESPICLVHYVGNSSCYLDSKHGNAKKTGYYLPTAKTVMKEIEGKVEGKTPKMVCETMHVVKSHQKRQDWMPVDRPRDRKQSENVKYAASQKKKLTNDAFFSSVELAIQTDNFV